MDHQRLVFQRVEPPWLYWRQAIFVVLNLAWIVPAVAGAVAGVIEVVG